MSDRSETNNILMQFGPLHGNVEKQEIHYVQPAPEQAAEAEIVDEPEVEQLTVQQIVILFEALLDVSLDPNFTNQSALATLLSRISGYKQSSMRAKITTGIDYDKPQAKADVAVVAALLDKIKPDLAEKLRNNVAE